MMIAVSKSVLTEVCQEIEEKGVFILNTDNVVILIPAYEPNEKMLEVIRALIGSDMRRILVVDDGSSRDRQHLFEEAQELGCEVIHHEQNKGKGEAIRTGVRGARELFANVEGIVTADADGQHLPEDIKSVADALQPNSNSLVLGVRDFSGEQVPARSRFGNRVTAAFFRLSTGVECRDTQTGLRGIPRGLFSLAIEEEGSRYEYEMNFLTDAAKAAPLVMVPISTVYDDGNSTSHFRVIRDSARIYSRPLKYAASSLTGAAADYILFAVFLRLLRTFFSASAAIVAATVLARIGSGIVNFVMNKKWSFASRGALGGEAVRYFTLFVLQMCTSAGLVALLAALGLPAIVAKLIVDTCLFFVSYQIQKRWVFRKELNIGKEEN